MYKVYYYHNMNKYWNKKNFILDERMLGFYHISYFSGLFLIFLLFDFLFSSP
jgi:hypothetical protein